MAAELRTCTSTEKLCVDLIFVFIVFADGGAVAIGAIELLKLPLALARIARPILLPECTCGRSAACGSCAICKYVCLSLCDYGMTWLYD